MLNNMQISASYKLKLIVFLGWGLISTGIEQTSWIYQYRARIPPGIDTETEVEVWICNNV